MYGLNQLVKDMIELLQDVRFLSNEMSTKDILSTLQVSDIMGLIDYKFIKIRDIANS